MIKNSLSGFRNNLKTKYLTNTSTIKPSRIATSLILANHARIVNTLRGWVNLLSSFKQVDDHKTTHAFTCFSFWNINFVLCFKSSYIHIGASIIYLLYFFESISENIYTTVTNHYQNESPGATRQNTTTFIILCFKSGLFCAERIIIKNSLQPTVLLGY